MKKILILIAIVGLTQMISAQKMISKNGHVWFYSHTPIEDIEAHNQQVVSIFDLENRSIQFTMLIKSFEFEKKLMQEHFNENYMESDEYPKAIFSGNLTKFENLDLKKIGVYPVEVAGDLTIHGVTKKISVPGTITVKENSAIAIAKFAVNVEDYNIKIPDVVKEKIAQSIEVNVDVTYMLN